MNKLKTKLDGALEAVRMTDELKGAILDMNEPKPRRTRKWVSILVAACIALAIGGVALAAFDLLPIGPQAEAIANMTPEEREADVWELPTYSLEAEIASLEEHFHGLHLITDVNSLKPDVKYSVLLMSELGSDVHIAFYEADAEMTERLSDDSIYNLSAVRKCFECGEVEFYFEGASIQTIEMDGALCEYDAADLRCAGCGSLHYSRVSDFREAQIPKGAMKAVAVDKGNGTFGIELVPATSYNNLVIFDSSIPDAEDAAEAGD